MSIFNWWVDGPLTYPATDGGQAAVIKLVTDEQVFFDNFLSYGKFYL